MTEYREKMPGIYRERIRIICALLSSLVLSQMAYGQSRSLNDRMPAMRWSLDMQLGAGLPISPSQPVGSAYAWSQPGAQVGVRYMFTRTLGVRPSYGYQRFRNAATGDQLNMHLYGVDLVYSLSDMFSEQRVGDRSWNVLAHAGAYYSFGHGARETAPGSTETPVGPTIPDPDLVILDGTDQMGTLTLGATLQYHLSSRLALTGDLSLYGSLAQQRGYHGESIDRASAEFPYFPLRLFLYPSIGIQYYIGPSATHVDWR